jgi:hypothetical protein
MVERMQPDNFAEPWPLAEQGSLEVELFRPIASTGRSTVREQLVSCDSVLFT